MHVFLLCISCVAYLSANIYATMKVGVFALRRSRTHLLVYAVPFLLWGSLILLGFQLTALMRRFNDWDS